jgi:hypothetical protein
MKHLRKFRIPEKVTTLLLLLTLAASAAFAQERITFAVAGDIGERGKPQLAISNQMNLYRTNGRPFQLVLLLGDNIYDNGIGNGFPEEFEKPFKDLIDAGVKFQAVLGNHDVRKGTEAQINYPKFNMGGRRFYSFSTGDGLAEFFALDSTALSKEAEDLVEANLTKLNRQKSQASSNALRAFRAKRLDSAIAESEAFLAEMRATRTEQIPWLQDTLRASTARWKIVFLHHAIYSSAYKNGGHGAESSVLRLRQLLTPIFFENNVDVVFAGHDHVVEKIKPQMAPNSSHKIYYITQGGSAKLRKGDLDKTNTLHEWGEDTKYSFLLVDLTLAELKIDVIDSTGKILKSFVITK